MVKVRRDTETSESPRADFTGTPCSWNPRSRTRRDDREYRLYLTEKQRRPREAAGHNAARLSATLDDIAAKTVVDEFWITDEQGVVYVTNVRDGSGARVPFRFEPDPTVQPQASAFHILLSSSVDNDDVVTRRCCMNTRCG